MDLWKTFANWIDAAESGELDPSRTWYVIWVSRTRQGAIVESFHAAQSIDEAITAIDKARGEIFGAAGNPRVVASTVLPYVTKVFGAKREALANIVERFTLEIGSGSATTDVTDGLRKSTYIPDWLVADTVAYAAGWVNIELQKSIETGKPATISVDAFRNAIWRFTQNRGAQALLLSCAGPPSTDQIEQELKVRTYVRQLDLIESDEQDRVQAVTDFLRAAADRTKWAVSGDVDRFTFDEFEDGLTNAWDAKKKTTDIVHSDRTTIQRGQLLYLGCKEHSAKLGTYDVGPYFCRGSFHELAEHRVIGWHPDYYMLLDNSDPEEASCGDVVK